MACGLLFSKINSYCFLMKFSGPEFCGYIFQSHCPWCFKQTFYVWGILFHLTSSAARLFSLLIPWIARVYFLFSVWTLFHFAMVCRDCLGEWSKLQMNCVRLSELMNNFQTNYVLELSSCNVFCYNKAEVFIVVAKHNPLNKSKLFSATNNIQALKRCDGSQNSTELFIFGLSSLLKPCQNNKRNEIFSKFYCCLTLRGLKGILN